MANFEKLKYFNQKNISYNFETWLIFRASSCIIDYFSNLLENFPV